MRTAKSNLEKEIMDKTLELLQKKEPYEIGMRDIAAKCGISATSIYLYFKDKNDLFRHISVYQLNELSSLMETTIKAIENPLNRMETALKTFRDWSFQNPKTAMLFMGKIDVDLNEDTNKIEAYYGCNRMGEYLLSECVKNQLLFSKDTLIDTNVCIFGLWGCIESILRQRADVPLWNKEIEYTDRFIQIFIEGLKHN